MKSGIKPFAQQGHYTEAHNLIFDYIMPRVSPNAFKVLCLILRRTKGWGKSSESISYDDIIAGTGIKSDATISRAIIELLEMGCIVKRDGAIKSAATAYALNRKYEIPAEDDRNAREASLASKNEARTDQILASKNEAGGESRTSKIEARLASKNEARTDSVLSTLKESTKNQVSTYVQSESTRAKKSSEISSQNNEKYDSQNPSQGSPQKPYLEGEADRRFESEYFLAVCRACARGPTGISFAMKCKLSVAAVTLEAEGYTPQQIEEAGQLWPHPTAPYPNQLMDNIKALLNRKEVNPNGTNQPNYAGSRTVGRKPAVVEHNTAMLHKFIESRQRAAEIRERKR
jgi:hypothetical protein